MNSKLRGHHIICLNFFTGEGYSQEFIENIHYVLQNNEMEVIEGADDVCKKCPYLEDGRCIINEHSDEDIRLQDREALRLLGLKPGMVLKWDAVSIRMHPILAEWKKKFCSDCSYRRICFG
jgi:hypothetical protein